jgi:hypothetical protein
MHRRCFAGPEDNEEALDMLDGLIAGGGSFGGFHTPQARMVKKDRSLIERVKSQKKILVEETGAQLLID